MNEDYRIFAQYVRPERPVNVTMAGISDCDRSYCIYRPEYSRYVIEHTVSGSGILEAGGEVCPIHAGDTYFLYGGRPHKYYCSGESWKKLWVVLDGEVAASLFHAYLPDQPNVLHDFDVYTEMQNIIALTRDSFCSYEEMVNRIVLIVHRILIAANARSGILRVNVAHKDLRCIDKHMHRRHDAVGSQLRTGLLRAAGVAVRVVVVVLQTVERQIEIWHMKLFLNDTLSGFCFVEVLCSFTDR